MTELEPTIVRGTIRHEVEFAIANGPVIPGPFGFSVSFFAESARVDLVEQDGTLSVSRVNVSGRRVKKDGTPAQLTSSGEWFTSDRPGRVWLGGYVPAILDELATRGIRAVAD